MLQRRSIRTRMMGPVALDTIPDGVRRLSDVKSVSSPVSLVVEVVAMPRDGIAKDAAYRRSLP
jgi:hypothetical protein